MANTNLSPSLLAKLKIRDTINKIKNKSPQLQDVLRQRCRERMKERRGQIFNQRRLGLELTSTEVEQTLTDVMCQEIGNLTNIDWSPPIDKLSFISDEPFDQDEALQLETELDTDEEQWIFAEYERMLQDEIEWLESLVYEDTKEVLCPVCQKSALIKDVNSVDCKACGLHLVNCSDIQTIGNLIDNCVNRHSTNCKEVPGFTILTENENSSLYMTCEDCSSLTFVV
ncbi:hypothetical protein KPH14_004005 [Odynerus spinipes]|uniref:RPA-interacting protein n=1 Tax=Odynerus spinipes TaxID=1348599 RepID=A0AAD9VVQ8_9HYME|nr:hypothetical protein KPH14_004005 [Odynerus spinipes]